MAETTTINFGWTMPDPGASANTWGSTLNATTQKVDNQVHVNQQRGVEIGSGQLWFTPTPPANWLLCDGSSLPTAAPYDKLFAVIGYQYGGGGASFNLPPANGRLLIQANGFSSLGATGGEATHALTWGETGPHYHNVPDPQHYHPISQGATQHTHAVSQNPHSHGAYQDAHAHAIPYDVVNPAGGGLTNGGASFGLVGNVGTDNRQPPVHIDTQQPGVNISPASSGISNTDYAATRISVTDTQGSGAPHNNMPPYLAVNFIIKYQ